MRKWKTCESQGAARTAIKLERRPMKLDDYKFDNRLSWNCEKRKWTISPCEPYRNKAPFAAMGHFIRE